MSNTLTNWNSTVDMTASLMVIWEERHYDCDERTHGKNLHLSFHSFFVRIYSRGEANPDATAALLSYLTCKRRLSTGNISLPWVSARLFQPVLSFWFCFTYLTVPAAVTFHRWGVTCFGFLSMFMGVMKLLLSYFYHGCFLSQACCYLVPTLGFSISSRLASYSKFLANG